MISFSLARKKKFNLVFENLKVLELVEDESDVRAAKELKAEVKADIAEFDENELAGGEVTDEQRKSDDMSKIENEFKSIETEVCISFSFLFSFFFDVTSRHDVLLFFLI